MEKRYYSGIGSRETPLHICNVMTQIAAKLCQEGWCLRSGGAIRADKAFEGGAGNNKEILRPNDATVEALEMASQIHPAWDKLNEYKRKLHARNIQIVLGIHLDVPVKFVICWTEDAEIVGGTGQALRLVNKLPDIEVRNLADPLVYERAVAWLNS